MTEWNRWREKHPNSLIKLEGADLLCAHLEGAKLGYANLQDVNLYETNLESQMNTSKLPKPQRHKDSIQRLT